jgi:hypothetical protein
MMRTLRPARSIKHWPGGYRLEIGSQFKHVKIGRREIYLRDDLMSDAATIIAAVTKSQSPSVQPNSSGAGNRGSGFRLNLKAREMFVRYARRGGLIRFLANDWHLGLTPRPSRELAVAAEARRRRIATAEPLGAVIEWIMPGIYRGAFLTRALQGMTLWQLVQTDDDSQVRMHVVAEARQVIDYAHDNGLFHADLNLHNIFVSTEDESFSVVLIDLDKARIYSGPLRPLLRARNMARLRRSIRKLDPKGAIFNQLMISTLTSS